MSGPLTPRHAVGALAALTLLTVTLLAVFAWPAARQEPRDLPIAVAGPPAAAEPLAQRLSAGGAFDVHAYADEAQARAAIEDREVYGAFVAAPSDPVLLTASAASPAVAQLLGQAAAERGVQRTVDVVPTAPDDPRGAGLAASVLPLLLVSLAGGLAVATLVRGPLARLAGTATVAVAVGAAAALVAQTWLGVVDGSWLGAAGVLALLVFAVATLTAGLVAALGRTAGAAATAVVVIVLGNPWSAAPSAPELLPQPIGAIGQLLPPGAGVSLLRDVAFFDGAGATGPLAVLLAWTALGLAALVVGRRSWAPATRRAPAPAP